MNGPSHPFRHQEMESTVRLEAGRRGMGPASALLVVDVEMQCMLLLMPGDAGASYPVSTSRLGVGEETGTGQTPRGFHEIVERYGEDAPPGAVFESRVFTGEVLGPEHWQEGEGDKILSRILRLGGREPGRNCGGSVDTYERMIYLHGTNQEQFVGRQPSSQGCIRMRNQDIMDLFERIRLVSAWVLIRAG